MSKHRKHWTVKEKLEILHYTQQYGATQASREYGISQTSIYKWKAVYEEQGESGLNDSKKSSAEKEEFRRLKRENETLKKIVAEKELQLRIQEEMLKKSH